MSTPRRDWPKSRGTPITRIFLGEIFENDAVVGVISSDQSSGAQRNNAFAQADSNFRNVSSISSTTLLFSSPSTSNNSGGVCRTERNNYSASFQLIEPLPGQRCQSRSLPLSWTWVE